MPPSKRTHFYLFTFGLTESGRRVRLTRTFQGQRAAYPFLSFYFWLDPKVTKAQEPIKGDFSFAKPRSLLPLHAFIAGLMGSAFLIFALQFWPLAVYLN